MNAATQPKIISDVSEIVSPGVYLHKSTSRQRRNRKMIAIEADLDDGYCICLDGWRFITNGYKVRHWKRFEAAKEWLITAAARDEYGLGFWLENRITFKSQ